MVCDALCNAVAWVGRVGLLPAAIEGEVLASQMVVEDDTAGVGEVEEGVFGARGSLVGDIRNCQIRCGATGVGPNMVP